MKNVFFLLILFSFLGCLPEADISISKVSDLPNSNTNGKTILTFKYTSKGSGALVADQIEVGTTVNFTPTTTGGAPTSFSITPNATKIVPMFKERRIPRIYSQHRNSTVLNTIPSFNGPDY